MPFDSQPKSERIGTDPLSGRVRRKLLEPFVYRVSIGGLLREIEVPVGFEYDGASIPKRLRLTWPAWLIRCLPNWLRWLGRIGIPVWVLFPPVGDYDRAAIIHDWCYSVTGDTPRCIADAIFYDAMLEEGVKWRRPVMFYAVRWFGGWAYHSK